jgi:hypothetical protein
MFLHRQARLKEPACRDPHGWAGQSVNGAIEPVVQETGREAKGQ